MKNKIILIAILICALLGTTIAFATETQLDAKPNINVEDLVGEPTTNEEENLETSTDEISRGDLYIIEEDVNVNTNVDGNLFIIAEKAEISANVTGNLFVIAEKVIIKGNVSASAFVLSEDINFEQGEISDIYFYAEDVSIEENAIVSREAKIMGKDVEILGKINGDLYSREDAIKVGESGVITGKLVYSGKLDQENGSQIAELEKQEVEVSEVPQKSDLQLNIEKIISKTTTAIFIIGLIVLISNKKIQLNPGAVVKGTVLGMLWIILIPIIVILLMITIIGLPFSLILLTFYILMFFIAIPAVALQIAEMILDKQNKDSKLYRWGLGVIVYVALLIIRIIPVIGVISTFILGLYGFNLIIKTLFSKKENTEKTESPVVTE